MLSIINTLDTFTKLPMTKQFVWLTASCFKDYLTKTRKKEKKRKVSPSTVEQEVHCDFMFEESSNNAKRESPQNKLYLIAIWECPYYSLSSLGDCPITDIVII